MVLFIVLVSGDNRPIVHPNNSPRLDAHFCKPLEVLPLDRAVVVI